MVVVDVRQAADIRVKRTTRISSSFFLLAPLCTLLTVFFVYPLLLILWNSVEGQRLTIDAYTGLLSSRLFALVLSNTVQIAGLATVTSLLVGYPIALHLSRQPPRRRMIYMMLVMLPFWTSILVKSYAFIVIFGDHGLVNRALAAITFGWLHLHLMFNRVGVVLGMVNYLLPFMVLPILGSLLAQDAGVPRAAEIMGAGPTRIFFKVTLPLSMPGVVAGVLMNLALAIGMYITPALLGGRRDMMMANLVDFYTRQTLDWPTASAIAIVLLTVAGALVALLLRVRSAEGLL